MNTANPNSDTLTTFIDTFEHLSRDSVPTVVACYDPTARFIDPFNDVTGSDAINKVFVDMFEQLQDPRFKVITRFESFEKSPDHETVNHHQAFITWDFSFRFASFRKKQPQTIHGSSHLIFSPTGKVVLHRDYWDAAHQLYEQFPLLGPVMRLLKRRMTA